MTDKEEVSEILLTSPFLVKFAEVLAKYSKDSNELDAEYLPAEFRGWPEDPEPYIVFFKRRNKEYWVLNYRTPRVAIYEIKKVTKDNDTGEKIIEFYAVHDRTVFNFVPVVIREFHDFTIELAAAEAKMRAPSLYQWVIAENSLSGPVIKELEPVLPVELLDTLRERGGLYTNESIAREAIDSILVLAKYLGAIEHVYRPLAPGIYWNPKTSRLEAYGFDTSMPSRVQVRDALKLLERIVMSYPDHRWYESWPVKFAKIFKWGLVAGIGYAYKVYNEKKRWVPYLLFIGESLTGKTQIISRFLTYLWKPLAVSTSIGSTWSIYNFGETISSVASIVVINEAAPLFKSILKSLNFEEEGDDFFNLVKSAPEYYLFRTKSYKGVRKVYPSLATLAFNANMSGIRNEGIRRRFFTIEFTKVDKIPYEVGSYFEKNIVPFLDSLSAIGRFVVNVVANNPEILNKPWENLAEELTKMLYEYAMLEMPEWVTKASLVDDYREELDVEKREFLSTWLRKYFDDVYFHYSRYADSSASPRDRVLYVLEKELSPYFVLKDGEVIIKRPLLDLIKKETKIDIYNFKALCELLGWDYVVKWLGKTSSRVGVVSLEAFLEFLGANEEVLDVDPHLASKVVDILAMGDFTFDELRSVLNVSEKELQQVLLDLERNMVVLPQDGRYRLNRARARELGFDVVGSYVVVGDKK